MLFMLFGNNGKTSEAALRAITQAVRREVRALARVRHPNVVRLYSTEPAWSRRLASVYAVYAVYAISSPDVGP